MEQKFDIRNASYDTLSVSDVEHTIIAPTSHGRAAVLAITSALPKGLRIDIRQGDHAGEVFITDLSRLDQFMDTEEAMGDWFFEGVSTGLRGFLDFVDDFAIFIFNDDFTGTIRRAVDVPKLYVDAKHELDILAHGDAPSWARDKYAHLFRRALRE